VQESLCGGGIKLGSKGVEKLKGDILIDVDDPQCWTFSSFRWDVARMVEATSVATGNQRTFCAQLDQRRGYYGMVSTRRRPPDRGHEYE